MAEKPKQETVIKTGFRLLKAGKQIAHFKRDKDIVIFENGKKSALKNITKKSYVPTEFIEKNNINLKHFEDKVIDQIPTPG